MHYSDCLYEEMSNIKMHLSSNNLHQVSNQKPIVPICTPMYNGLLLKTGSSGGLIDPAVSVGIADSTDGQTASCEEELMYPWSILYAKRPNTVTATELEVALMSKSNQKPSRLRWFQSLVTFAPSAHALPCAVSGAAPVTPMIILTYYESKQFNVLLSNTLGGQVGGAITGQIAPAGSAAARGCLMIYNATSMGSVCSPNSTTVFGIAPAIVPKDITLMSTKTLDKRKERKSEKGFTSKLTENTNIKHDILTEVLAEVYHICNGSIVKAKKVLKFKSKKSDQGDGTTVVSQYASTDNICAQEKYAGRSLLIVPPHTQFPRHQHEKRSIRESWNQEREKIDFSNFLVAGIPKNELQRGYDTVSRSIVAHGYQGCIDLNRTFIIHQTLSKAVTRAQSQNHDLNRSQVVSNHMSCDMSKCVIQPSLLEPFAASSLAYLRHHFGQHTAKVETKSYLLVTSTMNERANWEMSLRAVQTLYPAMNSGAIIHSNGLSITAAAQCCSGVLSTWVCACWGGTTIFPHFRYVGGGGLNVNIQNSTKIDEDNCGIPEGSFWAFFSTYGMEKKKRSKVRELSTNANSKKNKGDEKSDIFPFEGNDDSEHTEEELADDTVSDLCGFKSSLEVNCPRDLTKPRGYLLLGLKAGNRKKTPITTKTNFALFQGHDSETDFFSTDTEKERKFAAMTEEERDAVIKENEDADQEVEKLLMDEVERRQKQQQISKSSLHKGDQPLSFSGVKWLDELAVPEPPVIKCGVIKVNHSLLRHYFLNQSAFQVSCPDSNQPQFIPPSCKTSHLRKLQQQAYLINGGVSYFKLRVPIVIKTSLQEDQETTYNNRDHPITRSTISATTITPATRHFAIGYKYLSVIHNRSVDTIYTSRQDTWHQGAKCSAGRSAGYGMNLMWTTNEASGILLAVDGPLATISGGSTATKGNTSGTRMIAKQEPGGLFGRLALVQYPGWYLRIDNNKDKSATKYFTLEYEPPVYGGSGGAVHITSDGEMGGLAPQILRKGKPQAPALLSVKVLPCFRTPESLLQAPARVAAAVQTACATWPNDDKRGDDKSSFVRRKDLLVDDALYDMVVLDEAIGITMTIVIQEPKLNKRVKKVVLSEELQPSANSQNIEREKNSDLKKHCESDKIEQYMYVPTVMSSATESSLRTHGKNMVIAPVLTQSIEFTQAKLVSLQQHLLYSSHQAGEDVYLSDIDNRHGNGMYFNSTLIGDLDGDKAKSDELFLPPSDETDAIIEVVYHGNSLNNDMSGFGKNVDEAQSAAMKPRYHFPVNSRRALLHNLLGNVSEQGSLQSYSHVVEELGSQKNTPSTNGLLYNRLLYHPTLYSCTAVDRTTTGPPLSHIEFLHERIGDQTRLLLVGPTNAGKTFLLSHLWVKSREISRGETTRGTSFMHSGGAGQTEICVRVGNRLLKMSKEVSDTASESVTTKGSHISAYTRVFRGAPPTPNVKSALVASCFVTDLSGTAPSTLITSHASTSDIIALVFDYRDPYTLTQLLEKYIPHVCNGAPVAGVDFVFIGNHSDDPMATVGNFEVEQVIIKAKEIRKQRLLNLLKSKKPRVFESSSIDIGHSYSQVKGDESDLAQKREYEAKLCHKITILRERIRLKLHEEIHGNVEQTQRKEDNLTVDIEALDVSLKHSEKNNYGALRQKAKEGAVEKLYRMLSACEAELLTIGGLITGSNFYQDNEQHIEDNDIQFADVELFGIGSDRWHIWPVPSKPMTSYGSGGQSNNCTDFEEPTANKYINYYLEELLEDRLFSRVTALYGIDAAMEDALVSVIAGGYGDMKPPIPFKWRKASSFSFEASSRVLRSAAIRCGMPSSTHGTMTTEMLLDYWHLSLSKHAINCIEDDKSHQHQHNKGDEREAQGEDSLDLCSPVSTSISTRVGGLDWKSHSVASDDTLTSVLRKVSSKHSLKKKKMPDELQELIAMDITLNTIKGEGNGEKGHLRRYECGRMMSWRQLHDSNIITNNDVTLSSNTINCLVQEGNPLSYLMDVPLSPLWIFLRWLLAGVGVGDSRAEVLWRKLWLLGNSHRSNLKRFDALLNPSISSNYVKVLPISLLHFCLCDTTLSDHPFFEVKEKITEFRGISLTSIFPASSEGVSSKIVFSPLAASYLSTSPEWVMPPIEIINENIKVDQSFSSPYVTELLGRDKHSIPNALSVIDLFSFSGTDHYKHYLDPRCKMSIWHCAAGELRNVTREQGKETRENKKTPKGEVDLNAWVKSLPTELSDLLGGERYFSSDDESDDEEDIHPAKFLSGHNNAISALLWLRQVIVAQKLHPKQKRLIQTREFRQHILGLIEKAIDEASNEREEQLLSTRLLERHVIAMFSRANIDVSGRYEAFHDPNHKEVTNLKIITDRFTSLATQQRSCIFSKIQTFCKQGDNVVFDASQPASSYVNFKQVWSWLADLLTTSTIELTLPWIANNAPFSFFESTLQCSLSDMVSHTQTVTNVNPLGYTSPLQCFSVTDLMSHLWLVRLQGYPDELLSPKSIPYVKTSFYVDHSDGDVSYFAGGRREKQCHRCKANLIAFVRRPILCSSCQWQYCKNCIARRTFVVNYPYNSSLCKISPHIIRKKRRNKKKSSMSRLENKKKCIVLAFDDASIASPINEYWCMDCQKMLPPERTLHLKRLISLNNIQVSTESPSKVIKALIAKNETIIEHNNLSTGTILTSVLSQPEVIEPNTDESIVKSVNPRGSTTDKMVAFSNKVEIFHPDNSKKEIKTTTSFTPQAAERVASNWNNEIPAVAKWDTDEGYKCCTLCKGKFSIFGRRRHHCRACGTLCCVQCSPNRQEVAGYSGVQRVCRGCERNDDELSNKISTLESTGRLPATSPSEGSSHHINGFKSCLKSKSVEGVGNGHGMLDGLSSEASAALERLHRMQQSIEGSGFNIEQERQSAQAIQKDRCIAYHLVNTEYESRKQLSEASFLSPHNLALPPLPCGQFEDIQYNFPLHDTYDEVTDERVLNERMIRALMERIGELHSAVQAASTVDENGAVIEPVSTCDFFAQKGLVRHSEYKVSAIGYDDADEEFEGSIISEGPPQDTPPPLTPREDTTDKILESRNKSLVLYEPDVYIT